MAAGGERVSGGFITSVKKPGQEASERFCSLLVKFHHVASPLGEGSVFLWGKLWFSPVGRKQASALHAGRHKG